MSSRPDYVTSSEQTPSRVARTAVVASEKRSCLRDLPAARAEHRIGSRDGTPPSIRGKNDVGGAEQGRYRPDAQST